MISLAKLATQAILYLVTAIPNNNFNTPQEQYRLAITGEDIGLAVAMENKSPFEGSKANEAAVLALASIALHESGYQEKVALCDKRGDYGSSISIFQLNGSWAWSGGIVKNYNKKERNEMKELLCNNQALAAVRALQVLNIRPCKNQPYNHIFRAYASGSCKHLAKQAIDAGNVRCRTWERLLRKARLTGSCESRQPIELVGSNDNETVASK